jgi:CTP:molybdopterin cytidylyltransferase MocA
MISAILLAGGESRRMGEFKQLLRLGEKTFVEHCADNLLASRVDELVIVTGHRKSEVERSVGDRAVKFAHNHDYRSGMASSVKCGVQAISHGSQAFVIALVDQPTIGAHVVDSLIETYESMRPLIVIPAYDGRTGHPVLFDVSLKDEIQFMDPERGLRAVVKAHSNEIAWIEASDRSVLEDCDLPEDYARLIKL